MNCIAYCGPGGEAFRVIRRDCNHSVYKLVEVGRISHCESVAGKKDFIHTGAHNLLRGFAKYDRNIPLCLRVKRGNRQLFKGLWFPPGVVVKSQVVFFVPALAKGEERVFGASKTDSSIYTV